MRRNCVIKRLFSHEVFALRNIFAVKPTMLVQASSDDKDDDDEEEDHTDISEHLDHPIQECIDSKVRGVLHHKS